MLSPQSNGESFAYSVQAVFKYFSDINNVETGGYGSVTANSLDVILSDAAYQARNAAYRASTPLSDQIAIGLCRLIEDIARSNGLSLTLD